MYQVLQKCVTYRLNDLRVEQTKLNSNSQKVESANRVLRRSVPTNVTYARNFDGRSHSAVHSLNCGPGESLTRLLEQEGCSVPAGSRVATALLREQNLSDKKKKKSRDPTEIKKRVMKRCKLYKLHRQHKEEILYQKNQAILDAKLHKNIRKEHSNSAKPTFQESNLPE